MDAKFDTECCRTCLISTKDTYLFDNPIVLKKLEFATSLRVSENDGLPIYFCNSCQKRLEIAYEFRLQSIRSFKYLRNHLKLIQNQFKNTVKRNTDLFQLKEKDAICLIKNYKNSPDLDEKKSNGDNLNEEEVSLKAVSEDSADPLYDKSNDRSSRILRNHGKKGIPSIKSFGKGAKALEKKLNLPKKSANEDYFNENDGVQFSKCDTCQKMIKKKDLKFHKEMHSAPFTCHICKKSFTQKSSLRRHHMIHTGEKPYQCQTCDKRFSQSKTLKFHMALHGEDKIYHCSICNYRFLKPENLANHMREKHPSGNGDEVVLYVCQFCKKAFKSKVSLKSHKEKVHKNDIIFDMDWSDINNEESD